MAVAPDGSRLYLIDGGPSGSLRVFDTSTWQTIHQEPVTDRAQLLGGNPLSLSGDGRWLQVEHYSYRRRQGWTSLFDTRALQFLPRLAGAPAPPLPEQCREETAERSVRLAGRPGHARLYAACHGFVVALQADTLAPLWRAPAPTSSRPAFVLAPDGKLLYGLYPRVAVSYNFPDGHGRVTAGDLLLSVWETATGRLAQEIKLSDQASVPAATFGRGDAGYLGIAPDGGHLYVAWEDQLWRLAAESLRVAGELTLPAPVDGMALSVNGRELYLLPATAGDLQRHIHGLWTVDTTSLKLARHASDWPRLVEPFMFAAPAPR